MDTKSKTVLWLLGKSPPIIIAPGNQGFTGIFPPTCEQVLLQYNSWVNLAKSVHVSSATFLISFLNFIKYNNDMPFFFWSEGNYSSKIFFLNYFLFFPQNPKFWLIFCCKYLRTHETIFLIMNLFFFLGVGLLKSILL